MAVMVAALRLTRAPIRNVAAVPTSGLARDASAMVIVASGPRKSCPRIARNVSRVRAACCTNVVTDTAIAWSRPSLKRMMSSTMLAANWLICVNHSRSTLARKARNSAEI